MTCDCCNQEKDDLVTVNAVSCHVSYTQNVRYENNMRITETIASYSDFNPVELRVSEGCVLKKWPRARVCYNISIWPFIFGLLLMPLAPFYVEELFPEGWPFFVTVIPFIIASSIFFGVSAAIYSRLNGFRKYRNFEKLSSENKLDEKTGKKYEKFLRGLKSKYKRLYNIKTSVKDITNDEVIADMLVIIVRNLKLEKLKGLGLMTLDEYERKKRNQYNPILAR